MNEYADRPFTVASFIQFIKEKKLMGTRCRISGSLFLPPRAICPECYSNQMEWVELGGKGVLAAFTIIYSGFKNKDTHEYLPYCTGIIELEERVKISAIILGLDIAKPNIRFVVCKPDL
jgi:uncharacterized OB-fold protein